MNQYYCVIFLTSLVRITHGSGETLCGISADIAFLLDSTRSIDGDDFALEKQFVKDVVSLFDVGPERTRVSVLQYAEKVLIDFYLDQFDIEEDIHHRLDKLQQSKDDRSRTDLALQAARVRLLDPEYGARLNVPRICILLSGGASARPALTLEEAQFVKDAGITLLAVGVGKARPEELVQLVSAPADDNFFYAKNFAVLKDVEFQKEVAHQTCEGQPTTEIYTPSTSAMTSSTDNSWTPIDTTTTTYSTTIDDVLSPTAEMSQDSQDSTEKTCQGKAADVVFVLDMSSSIWRPHFQQQLEFVTTVIDTFDLDAGKTRVGALVYSTEASVLFDLDTYTTKEDLANAILATESEGGITNTHLALQLLVDRMFTAEHGSRPGVAHICILITDGRSSQPLMTNILAEKIHQEGIYMFAIGVGNMTDGAELAQMASTPTEEYMFEVNGYEALPKIRKILTHKACEVQQADQPEGDCVPGAKTDIVFGLYNIGGSDRDQVTEFIKSVAAGLDLTSGDVRIAISEVSGAADFALTEFSDMAELQEALEKNMTTDVSVLLQNMRNIVRGPYTSRGNRMAVLLVSGLIKDMGKAYTQAMRLKFFAKLVVVGIGDYVDRDQLVTLASHRKKYDPDNSHVLPVSDLAELPMVAKKLLLLMCNK